MATFRSATRLIPQLARQQTRTFASALKRGVRVIGCDWDETLHRGDNQTKEILKRVYHKFGVSESSLERDAEFVRAHTKNQWGSRTSATFEPEDEHVFESMSDETRQRIFSPTFRALMHQFKDKPLAQSIAQQLVLQCPGTQVKKDAVQKLLLENNVTDITAADSVMAFISNSAELPLLPQLAPLDPSRTRGVSAKGLQHFMLPAFHGLSEAGFAPDKATDMSLYFTEIAPKVSLETSKLLPGARETLQMLNNMGISVPIFSNKDNGLLKQEVVAKNGLEKLVSGVYGAVDGQAVKPDPEMVTSVVENAEDMVFVDDRPSGPQMAKKLGCRSVLFNSGNLSEKEIALLQPTYVVRDHAELQRMLPKILAATRGEQKAMA